VEKARIYNQYIGSQLTHWEILELPEDELNLALDIILAQMKIQSEDAKRKGRARPRQTGRPR